MLFFDRFYKKVFLAWLEWERIIKSSLSGETLKEIECCALIEFFLWMLEDSEYNSLGTWEHEGDNPGNDHHQPGSLLLFHSVDGGEWSGYADVPEYQTFKNIILIREQRIPINAEYNQEIWW